MASKKLRWWKRKSRGSILDIDAFRDSDAESILKSDVGLRYSILYENERNRGDFLWKINGLLGTVLVASFGALITLLIAFINLLAKL